MPRGNEAKAARSHNRACMRGRSTANSSASAYNQIKGKKYIKGETSSIFKFQAKLVTYDSNQYLVNYRYADPNTIEIGTIVKSNKSCTMQQILDNVIEDQILRQKICAEFIKKFKKGS